MGDINNKESFLTIKQLQPCQKSSRWYTHSSYRTLINMLISGAPLPSEVVAEPIPGLIFLLVDLFIAKFQNQGKKKMHFSNVIYEVPLSKRMHAHTKTHRAAVPAAREKRQQELALHNKHYLSKPFSSSAKAWGQIFGGWHNCITSLAAVELWNDAFFVSFWKKNLLNIDIHTWKATTSPWSVQTRPSLHVQIV